MAARPATTDDLDQLEAKLTTRIEQVGDDLRGEMAEMKTELRGDMSEMKTELMQHIADASVHTANIVVERMNRELARHTAASAEETHALLRALDDKYNELPTQVADLRQQVEDRCPPADDKS